MKGNVYPDKSISGFIEKGVITSDTEICKDQIQPSSLDLRSGFGKKIWHMPYSSIPQGDLIRFLDAESTHNFQLTEKRFLHKRGVYIVELEEGLALPEGVSARSNPKSTTGRLDIHTRLLTEEGQVFDNVRESYKGKLFLEVVSNSFDLFLPPGFSFNQIRFFHGFPQSLNQGMLEYLARSEDLLVNSKGRAIPFEEFIQNGAVSLKLDLDPKDPGYIVREDAPPLDLSSNKNSLPFSQYFQKVNLIPNKGLVIGSDLFYLLKSGDGIQIPRDHCAEMLDISTDLGEFRAHYAGFFDPMFRATAVMEVRNSGPPFLLKNGQIISSLNFFALTEPPLKSYGKSRSSYQGQRGVKPAKFFNINK
tara:strand:+ start:2135 stop:3220 length:1086 start_codon:yes stop_codon:yes gene_type:complete